MIDYEEEEEELRECSECGKEITEGYCIDNGLEYYCSEECLHKHYTEEEYWWNCGDSKIREDLMEELANVYTCNIQFVINNLKEDLGYNIEKIEEE